MEKTYFEKQREALVGDIAVVRPIPRVPLIRHSPSFPPYIRHIEICTALLFLTF